MANLIIKPQNTSGDKVIIQDQAGGAVLTTADSGATLGNSTQDNITRLGTVTTGSIAGGTITNATTFPAGHIIQVVEGPIITGGLYNTESWGEHNSGSRVSLTPSATSSKIYIIGVMTCYIQGGGNKTDFRRDIGGTVTMPLFNSSYGRYMGAQTNGIANHGSWNIWGIDSPSTTSAVTYSWASISTTSPYNSYTHKNSQITLMEIKG